MTSMKNFIILFQFYFFLFSIKFIAGQSEEDTNMCGERMEKLKEFYCVSQCIGVSELVDMQLQNTRLTKAIRTQPMSPTLRCSALDISGKSVKECCQGPMPDLFFEDKNNVVQKECIKTTGVDEKYAYQYLSEYMLHKWQDGENVFDIHSPMNVPNHKIFCFVECIFSKQQGGKWWIDLKVMTNALRSAWKSSSTKYGDVINKAIDYCSPIIETMLLITQVTVNNKPCYTAPLMFLQCVRRTLNLECTMLANAGAKCSVINNLKSCDFFQY